MKFRAVNSISAMKCLLLVISVTCVISIGGDRVDNRNNRYRIFPNIFGDAPRSSSYRSYADRPPRNGFFSTNGPFRNFLRGNVGSGYDESVAQPHSYYVHNSAGVYGAPLDSIVQPFTDLVPPVPRYVPTTVASYASKRPNLPRYTIETAHDYPKTTVPSQLFHKPVTKPSPIPTLADYSNKGKSHYPTKPVRHYVPVYSTSSTEDFSPYLAPTYSTLPYWYQDTTKAPKSHAQEDVTAEEEEDPKEEDYYNLQEESPQEDIDDDYDDQFVEKGTVAEKRFDGPTEINALSGSYEDDYVVPHKNSDVHFSKEDGVVYGNEKRSKKGYKSSEGHNSEHKFDKGNKGHHDKESHSKEYEKEGKEKKSHHDEKDKHASHHEEGEGEKSGKFDEKKKHRKGSKSKGYHNVYHKDEYVKDHTFYDDVDDSGHYKKHGKEHKKYHKDSEDHKKGEHHDSAHKEGKKSHDGKYHKGHHDDADSGYDKKHGHGEHHKKKEGYSKKGANAKNSHYSHKKDH